MDFSRRDLFLLAGGSVLVPWASESKAWPVITALPFGQNPARTSPFLTTNTTTEDSTYTQYNSTLVSGYTPKYPFWLGQRWTADMGSAWNANMNHCWRVTTHKSRFELHNTVYDRGQNDPSAKRRTEIHDKLHLLKNGTAYWGAYSFIDHSWSDPIGMANYTTGGAHFQMHMPGGGSPVFAFRRFKNGSFGITTNPGGNVKRLARALSFDSTHDVVYRCVLHPTSGQLDVWLDRVHVLAYRGPLADSSLTSGYYPCYGLYYADGCTCNIVSERANIAAPTTASLSGRVTQSPAWPAS